MVQTQPQPPPGWANRRPGEGDLLTVVLIEDDRGDALLVEELLDEAGLQVDLVWVRTVAEAVTKLSDRVQCVLLDLALPDADGLDGLETVLGRVPGAAILVLTGLADEHRGVQAVAAGAQDYLVKGQVDGQLLARAIRFSVERKRAEEGLRRLREATLHAMENARLERGLLPIPSVRDQRLRYLTRCRPGRRQTLLGGDFYDLVEADDGTVYLLVGDVCGHGPDEAALGVCLRAGWRTMVFAGTPPERMLSALNQKIIRQPGDKVVFATVCMLVIPPDRRTARQFLAGHPPPLLLAGAESTQLPVEPVGPALGVFPAAHWPSREIELPTDWILMLYTDGLFEGRIGPGAERLGEEGLVELVRRRPMPIPLADGWPDELIDEAQRLNGGPLSDDVAVLLLAFAEGRR